MSKESIGLREAGTFEEARASLGAMLGLDGPAPPEVVRRAIVDKKYAMYLMMVRESPSLRSKLLNDLRNEVYRGEGRPGGADADATDHAPAPSAADAPATELAGRAATAMLKWAAGGFQTADAELVARRWSACQACEYLADPPDRLLYKGLQLIMGPESKICAACGCLARRKVALPGESCPKEDPARPGFTRWGDPTTAPREPPRPTTPRHRLADKANR